MGRPSINFAKLAKKFGTPKAVQKFLKTMPYNNELKGETVRSAAEALRLKSAHCLESALLAAAILEHKNYPTTVLYLDSKDDLGHVVFVYKAKTGWGSIARSRYEGLHGRAPRYRSLRDLAWSYYDPFIDKTGRLIGYSFINLDDSQTDWRHSHRQLRQLEEYIVSVKVKKITSSEIRFKKVLKQYKKTGVPTPRRKFWW